MTPAHQTGDFAELVCSNSFPRRRSADERDRHPASRDAAARTRSSSPPPMRIKCRPAARSRSIATALRSMSRGVLRPNPTSAIARDEVAGLPPADWDQVIIATGPLTSPALGEAIRDADRRSRPRLFRRHRADRRARDDRHGQGLVPIALRPRGTRRRRRRLHQLPAHARAIRSFHRRPARPAKRSRSRTSRTRPISTAACRSK